MKILKYALIALFSIAVMSCGGGGGGDDVDDQKPNIVIQKPTDNQVFSVGSNVPVSFSATDNVSLKSYVVNVDLIQIAAMTLKTAPVDFVFDKTGDFSGKTQTIDFNMELPLNSTKGKYMIEVKVTDGVGNVATKQVSFNVN